MVFTLVLGAVLATLSIALSPGAALADGGRHHRSGDVTFTKWVTSLPADPSTLAGVLMAGVVGGDVGRGRYAGLVISDDTTSMPGFWLGHARYEFYGRKHFFIADQHITENDTTVPITYLGLLGPLGWAERDRYVTYRGTEEVVYLGIGGPYLGIRPADGGTHRYYGVGLEHLAFEVDRRDEVDDAYARCLSSGAKIHFPPEEDRDEEGYYAFFVFDPDGIRVELFCWPREGTTS